MSLTHCMKYIKTHHFPFPFPVPPHGIQTATLCICSLKCERCFPLKASILLLLYRLYCCASIALCSKRTLLPPKHNPLSTVRLRDHGIFRSVCFFPSSFPSTHSLSSNQRHAKLFPFSASSSGQLDSILVSGFQETLAFRHLS